MERKDFGVIELDNVFLYLLVDYVKGLWKGSF